MSPASFDRPPEPLRRALRCAVCDLPGTHPINRRRRGRAAYLCTLHWEVYIELQRGRLRRGLDEAMRRLRRSRGSR